MNKNITALEELIQHYGLRLAQQALWSPDRIRKIAAAALTHCSTDPRSTDADTELFTPAKIVIKTGAISSECTPETAQALVKALKENGWPVSYGGRGNGSILPNTSGFSHAFYAALAEITRIP